MKNLEIKANCPNATVFEQFEKYYAGTLNQTDTYYECNTGRLKLREEQNKPSKIIHYDRSNEAVERISRFDFYPIDNVDLFKKVFGGSLKVELTVTKTRKLYLYKHARIHHDRVDELPGKEFVKIEVLINNKEKEEHAPELMKKLLILLNIKNEDKIDVGYRELIIKKH
jgi:adenylate cyclase class IV